MRYALLLSLMFAGSPAANAEIFNIPGNALTLKTLDQNLFLTYSGRSVFVAPLNYTGTGRVCSVTMMAGKHSRGGKLNLTLWKHSAVPGASINSPPTKMVEIRSKYNASPGPIQLYTESVIANADVDSSHDFVFAVVDNAHVTKIMGLTVEILPQCTAP